MSLWLLRQPRQLARIQPAFVLLRPLGHVARSNVPSLLAPSLTPRPLASLDTVLLKKRWQSTKEESQVSTEAKPNTVSPVKEDSKKQPVLSRVWRKVKHEAQHYWSGSKLLVSEIRISGRLQWKLLQGETLTRRERRQVRPFVILYREVIYKTHISLNALLKIYYDSFPSPFS